MTVNDIVSRFNGVYIEVAGTTAKNQCVDLANLYIRDVLNLPIVEWANAKDFPSRVSKEDYDYILNSPTGVPKEGDLVIWGGTYGHIAIFIEGDANRFKSFDQNYPTDSPCHIQEHNYNNVLGWLHPKAEPSQDALTECLRLHGEAIGTIEKELKPRIAELEGLLKDRDSAIEGLKGEKKSFEDFQMDLAKTLGCDNQQSSILGEIKTLISQEDRMNQAEKISESMQKQIDTLTAERDTLTADQSVLKGQLLEIQSVAKVALENESKALKELENYRLGDKLVPIFKIFGYFICK